MASGLFLLSALRAIIEMLGLALLGQAVMALLAGAQRARNPIYQLFALLTRWPRHVCGKLCGKLLPGARRPWLEGALCFLLLFIAWIGLAAWRLSLLAATP